MKHSLLRHIIIVAFAASQLTAILHAQDQRLEMEGTSIIGNKELPKVLYIVPWKASKKIDISTPPFASILDQPLKQIDRKTFRRQIQYHGLVFPQSTENP